MIKWGCFFIFMTACILLGSCVMNRISEESETINLRQSMNGRDVSFTIVKGEYWSRRMKAGPFIFNILPQIVIWTENEENEMIDTLYITGADGTGFRHAGKKDKGADFYRECFPVWSSRMEAAGRTLPGKDNPYPDTVTSATPSSGFILKTRMIERSDLSGFFLEINQSSDYNSLFTEEYSGWSGQPSVIYYSAVEDAEDAGHYEMTIRGMGSNIGETPELHFDVSQLDTALSQVSKIMLDY